MSGKVVSVSVCVLGTARNRNPSCHLLPSSFRSLAFLVRLSPLLPPYTVLQAVILGKGETNFSSAFVIRVSAPAW